jgi:glycosyltransferase involved in cell wall biosynthesis
MIHVLLMIDDATMGGGQQHLLSLATHLDRRRFKVSVACEEKGYLVDELKRQGITVYPLSMTNQVNLSALRACLNLVRAIRPDVVHTHGGTAGFVGRLSALFARTKTVIHTYHGLHYLHEEQTIRKRLYRWVDWLLMFCTDWLICVAHKDYELGMQAGIVSPLKSVVIPNGIDVQKYSVAIGDQNNARRKKNVGTIGRLHLQKGHRYFLDAAVRVIDQVPDVLFQIVGEGELREPLERQAQSLGIDRYVEFLGNRLDIPELLANMDVFVLPSLWEGLPLVLLEAMAARKPIVSTDVDGVNEVIVHAQDGLLVPPKNPAVLADAIVTLLVDQQRAKTLALNAYKKVVSEFDAGKMIAKIENLYETTLARVVSNKGER